MSRWARNKKKINSATPSQNNTLELERSVSKLPGVVGNTANPDMQVQAVSAGFWTEKKTGCTYNDVEVLKGLFHVFESC